MNKFEEAKKIYETITPPKFYNQMVEQAVNGDVLVRKKTNHYIWYKMVTASAAAVFAIFVIMLNTIPSFASAAYEIPVLGDIARVFTFREYQLSSNVYDIQVEVPSIRNTRDTDLEKRVNNQIQDRIDQIVENAKQRGKQAIDDQLAEGGKEDLIPFHIMITYELKSSNENTLSFVVNDTESSVTSYTYQTFYNIDLKTHKDITLSDKLGGDYSKIIVDSIQKQIEQRIQEHPDWSYTVTETDLKEMVNDIKFYINDVGNVVISFDKGEIAPPPMGIQDFEIII
ncbi:DUF3298 and DUF4163 domain-containing protein [Clostridium sp. E02]|uniref:DUF3298 and DUF4163 domain-containing protein n=1 Tax=Clostridium sp. E02 TaxID=2487134 RepID=UPI0013DE0EF8|nr:DUF3298 and DUF4163 domain-containing protein [Clostridium sp. E02]